MKADVTFRGGVSSTIPVGIAWERSKTFGYPKNSRWQLKYTQIFFVFTCILVKMNPLWLAHIFLIGLVQPPPRFRWKVSIWNCWHPLVWNLLLVWNVWIRTHPLCTESWWPKIGCHPPETWKKMNPGRWAYFKEGWLKPPSRMRFGYADAACCCIGSSWSTVTTMTYTFYKRKSSIAEP